MNPLLLIAAALAVLGLGEIASLVGVLFRYAIPKAPVVFHWLLALVMVPAAAACFVISWMALSGSEMFYGLHPLTLLIIFFLCEAAMHWILISYAVYHWRRGTKCPV